MGVEVLRSCEVTADGEATRPDAERLRPRAGWNPENFAREQIRGLVRQVFFANVDRPPRQVVFSAVEPGVSLRDFCRQVAEALALQTPATVAVVGKYPRLLQEADTQGREPAANQVKEGGTSLHQIAARVCRNLWLLPDQDGGGDSPAALHAYLGEVRRQFDYSIVQGLPVGESDATAAMAQFADGIILVLSAHRTRRAAARQIKIALAAAQVCILGAVLADREFPIPEAIYRRL